MKSRMDGSGRRIFLALILAVLGTTEGWGQHDQWIVGSQRMIFGAAGITTEPLPSFLGTDPLEYHGEKAEFAQQLLWDHEGNLAAFMVDGRIYDEEGYLIADAWPTYPWYDTYYAGDTDCEECVPSGITEMIVVPVPGRCLQYLLFTARIGDGQLEGARTFLSYLDLTIPNPHFSLAERTGSLVDLTNIMGYDAFTACSEGFHGDDNMVGELPTPWISTLDRNLSVHMDALDLGWGEDKWVFVADGQKIQSFQITASEVINNGEEVIFSESQSETRRMPQGELECILEEGEIVVAFPRYTYTTSTAYDQIVLARYTPQGSYLGNDIVVASSYPYDPFEDCVRINGLEFSQNGDYLFFLRSSDPELGYVELTTLTVTIPSDPDLDMFDHRNSELERDDYFNLGGAPPYNGMYAMASDGRLGRLLNTNTPIGLTWDPDFLQFSTSDVVSSFWVDFAPGSPPDFDGDCPDQFHLLQSQTHNFTPFGPDFVEACCDAIIANRGYDITLTSGTHNWAPGSNPFGNATGPVYVLGDLVVPSGALVYVDDMEIRFGPDAVLVIEPGGYLNLGNSTLTNACEDRWKGVEVRGNLALTQLPYSNQGRFYAAYSTIENAKIGALCATRTGNGQYAASGYRGIVQSSHCTWRNNIVDLDIRNDGLLGSSNSSWALNSDFVSDEEWPDAAVPHAHVRLTNTGAVEFSTCKFRNANATFTDNDRGFGILSSGGTMRVLGNGDPADSYFEGLYCGASIGKHRYYWMRDMNFRTCTYGLADLGPQLGEVSGNVFDVPEWTIDDPSPVGLLLYQTQRYIVENNVFQSTDPNSNVGIAFWGPMEAMNRIYNNAFIQMTLGTLVIGDHFDANFLNGLQPLCGDYTDNKVDYGVGPNATLDNEQGIPGNQFSLAGNRFFVNPDCTNEFDLAFETSAGYFDYNRSTDPICDPDCPDGAHYSDNPFPAPPFDKEVDCGEGAIPDGDIIIGPVMGTIKLAKAQFESALQIYHGVVDQGEKEDLLEAINAHDPWRPSHELRDLLLAHHPLSDEVLDAVLDRAEPMDGWHITQIFLQNVPLQGGVHAHLKGSYLVSAYQLALVGQAQQNANSSYKEAMEEELHQRAMEHYLATVDGLRYWANDTLEAGAEDSLLLVLESGIGTGGRMALLLYQLERRNWTALDTLMLEDWYLETKHDDLRAFVQLIKGVLGEVDSLTAGQRYTMGQLAKNLDAGAALSWNILLEVDAWRLLPEVQIPSNWKRYEPGIPAMAVSSAPPLIEALPNPSSGQLWISYDVTSEADELVIYGPLGTLVHRTLLTPTNGLVELDGRQWADGIYVARAQREGVPVAETKFTVLSDTR